MGELFNQKTAKSLKNIMFSIIDSQLMEPSDLKVGEGGGGGSNLGAPGKQQGFAQGLIYRSNGHRKLGPTLESIPDFWPMALITVE